MNNSGKCFWQMRILTQANVDFSHFSHKMGF